MNTQKDSIPVQLFIKLCIFICFTLSHYHSNLVHTFLSLFNITDLKVNFIFDNGDVLLPKHYVLI